LQIEGCLVVSAVYPYGRNLGFLDHNCYFLFQAAPQLYSEAEWTPFQTRYFSEYLVAPETEAGTSGYVSRNSDY
jgi:hypothetical protein